jgi:phospholipid/cholesterol/gamma-HCH transport system ATP-binding protein
MENVIEFRNVAKRFGDAVVLDGLSFCVRKGEILSIVGPSGTGKSVTLKHAVGLVEPDSGAVETSTDRIGYLFQSGALLAWMTAYENVALPLVETTKLSEKEIDDKVMDALRAVGLEDAADKYPSEMSGGMQKRAGLARAIVCDAEVILYDEPTSGLDPVTSASIMKLICDLRDRRGVTSVVVTHDLAAAMRTSDRIMLVSGGKSVICAPPAEFAASRDPLVVEYLSAMKGDNV